MYMMFGELVGQSTDFMRYWLRCHVLTHKKTVNSFAWEYFKSKGMKLSDWLCSIHTGKRADVLALFLLSQITETQCFVHCTCNSYRSMLKDEPVSHEDFMQHTNLHSGYLG